MKILNKQTYAKTNLFSAFFILFSSRVGFSWRALQGEILALPRQQKCTQPKPHQNCLKPMTNHLGQLKILLENYHFTSLGFFFPDSVMPEEENRSSERLSVIPLPAARPPTSPPPQGAPCNPQQQGEKKAQISHLGKTLEPHRCVIDPETGAARHHSQAVQQDRNPAAFPHSRGHDGERGIKISNNSGLWLHPNSWSCKQTLQSCRIPRGTNYQD